MFNKEEWCHEGAEERINEILTERGMTRKELAKKAGMSYGNVCRVLGKNRKNHSVGASDDFLRKVIRALDVDPMWVLFGIRREGA